MIGEFTAQRASNAENVSIWWRHHGLPGTAAIALLAFCEGNPPVTIGFPTQRPVMLRFDVLFDLRLNKRLSKNRDAGDLRRHRAHYELTVMYEWNQEVPNHTETQKRRQLYIDGLLQDCSNSSALAMELLQACTKPSIYTSYVRCTVSHIWFRTKLFYTNRAFLSLD